MSLLGPQTNSGQMLFNGSSPTVTRLPCGILLPSGPQTPSLPIQTPPAHASNFPTPYPGLIGRPKFYVLRLTYVRGIGFLIHGLWICEFINGQLRSLANEVLR